MSLMISVGSGATIATDQIAGAHYGYNKIVDGTPGSTNAWVVNAAGQGQMNLVGNATLSDSKGYIGLVSVAQPLTTTFGNVTISDSKGFIGLTTAVNGQAWPDPKTFIGLVTVGNTVPTTQIGNVTLDAGSKTQIVGNITLTDSKQYIGLVSVSGFTNPLPVTSAGNVTLDKGSITQITGNITLSDPKTFIGLTTTVNSQAWPDPKGFIGLVTITGSLSAAAGNVTLDAGSKTGIVGNVTISDSKGYIGLATVTPGAAWPDPKGYIGLVTITGSLSAAAGNVTLDAGSKTGIVGNVTLSDPKGFIGLTTAVNGQAWPDPKTYIGLVTVTLDNARGVAFAGNVTLDKGSITQITGNVTLSDPKTFIGLVTVGNTVTVAAHAIAGNVTLDKGSITSLIGSVTLADSKQFIGLVTIGGMSTVTLTDSKTFIGLVTIGGISQITLSDPKGFIGLVTTVPSYISGYTSLATILSATGLYTIVVAPAGQKTFLRNVHVSSLGRSEISFWASGTAASSARIPWTSLSTTGGFYNFYGENGMQMGNPNFGLNVALNGAATVGVAVDVRFV